MVGLWNCEHIHLPRKQRFIYRELHQYATIEGMDGYRLVIGHMESDLSDKIKRSFSRAAVVSILLYGCTTWILTNCTEKKLHSNCTRMLWAILNKSWRQHPTKQHLCGHLTPISNTIEIRQIRLAGHCWRSKDKLISDVLLWTLSHGWARVGRPARTYLQRLCTDTGCSIEDLPGAMDDKKRWREKVREIRARSTT